ncbi:12805_t:CDS:2 [Ambispora gerdemannii]|uniref:12805_t:CDS:1 n=1 Tax=Ambispora gerdemannii TaxID=144530 RepID=A0A9N9HAF7_9GLOM|nr:12805_t:CDS:2 [Ambispora gerdemannii]
MTNGRTLLKLARIKDLEQRPTQQQLDQAVRTAQDNYKSYIAPENLEQEAKKAEGREKDRLKVSTSGLRPDAADLANAKKGLINPQNITKSDQKALKKVGYEPVTELKTAAEVNRQLDKIAAELGLENRDNLTDSNLQDLKDSQNRANITLAELKNLHDKKEAAETARDARPNTNLTLDQITSLQANQSELTRLEKIIGAGKTDAELQEFITAKNNLPLITAQVETQLTNANSMIADLTQQIKAERQAKTTEQAAHQRTQEKLKTKSKLKAEQIGITAADARAAVAKDLSEQLTQAQKNNTVLQEQLTTAGKENEELATKLNTTATAQDNLKKENDDLKTKLDIVIWEQDILEEEKKYAKKMEGFYRTQAELAEQTYQKERQQKDQSVLELEKILANQISQHNKAVEQLTTEKKDLVEQLAQLLQAQVNKYQGWKSPADIAQQVKAAVADQTQQFKNKFN